MRNRFFFQITEGDYCHKIELEIVLSESKNTFDFKLDAQNGLLGEKDFFATHCRSLGNKNIPMLNAANTLDEIQDVLANEFDLYPYRVYELDMKITENGDSVIIAKSDIETREALAAYETIKDSVLSKIGECAPTSRRCAIF